MKTLLSLFIASILLSLPLPAQSRIPADPNVYLSSTRNASDGDQDFMQTVFFEVPDSITSTLYFAVNNPGSTGVTPDQVGTAHMSRFQLFGGPGCYTNPSARALIVAGNDKYIGNMIDWHYDDAAGWNTAGWAYFGGVSPTQGEHIGSKYYFKITVEAIGGAPAKNSYQYDVSYTNTGTPTGVSSIKAFAYVLGVALVRGSGRQHSFYPFVPDTATGSIVAANFDFDNNNTGAMYDPSNAPQGAIAASANGTTAQTSFAIGAAQKNATWKAVYTDGAAGTDVIDVAEVWFKNSITGELYPMYAAPYAAPSPDHVVMTFTKEVVVPPLGFDSYSSNGVAIADNNDTVTVNLQVVDYSGSPLPLSRNIYVTLNNGGTITGVNPGSTNNVTTAMIKTDPSGMGYLTIRKPPPAGTVDVAAYWDGLGAGDIFGSHSSAFVTASFVVNNTPTIQSYYSMTFPTGAGPVDLNEIVLVDALVSSFFVNTQSLRIRIPASLDCTWDTSVTNPTLTVNGNGTVNLAVSYPNSKTLRIGVTSTFNPVTVGVTPSKLTIGGLLANPLSFVNLNSASAGHLELSWDDGATYQAVDDRIYTILDASPFITAVETCDLNNDGYLDALHVIFNKNMKDTTIAAAATGFAIAGVTGTGFLSTTNSDTANDNDIYITFTDGVLKSGQTVQVSYDMDVVGADITDNDGAPHALPDQGPLTAVDKAGPAILSARTRTVNTVELTLSEPVDDRTISGADFTFSGFATGGANAAGIAFDTGGTANDNVVVVTLAASIGVAETGFARFAASGLAGDPSGNTNTQTATVSVSAGISTSPVILSMETTDANNNGFIDGIKLVFTKNMKDSTFISTGDFNVAGATVTGFATGGTANDTVVYLNLTDGVLNTGATPAVTYTAGSVTDNDPTPVALPSQPAQAAADRSGPAILSARTFSTTQVEITLSEPVADLSIWGGDFTFSGFTTGGANAAGVGFATGTTANDNVILITLAASIGINETGNVRFTNSGYVNDLPGNANTQSSLVAVTDGNTGAPAILYAETADTNSNGFIDRIKLVFNRNMNDATFTTAAWFAVAGGTVTGFNTGTTVNDNVMYLTITDGVLGSGLKPNVSYTPGTVRDGTATLLAAYPAAASLDKAGIAIVSARTTTVNTVEITLSESADDSTVSAADFIFSGFGTPDANGQGIASSTGGTANDNLILITLPASLNSPYTGFVRLSSAGLLSDLAANANTQTAVVAVTSSVPATPTMTSVETLDLNNNGYIDAVHITFSTSMDDTTISAAAAGFTVAGAGALAFSSTTNGDTAADADVYLTFTDGVLATGATPAVSYVAGTVKSASGTSMLTHAAPATLDKAGPAILSARTTSVNTVQVTFSESVADSSIIGSDFTFSGFATLSANAQGIGFSTGGTPNDNVVVITLPATIGNTETGNIRFSNTASVNDPSGNGNGQTAAVAVNDGIVPVVTGVSASNANGLFKLGDVVTVQVSFSKAVTVAAGTPTLTLETGAVDRTVSYTSGSGTSTLNFSYTVGAGDVNADLDYVAIGSLSANGATIRDSHLNDATLTLAAPGAAGSLAANKNLDVDGAVAVVTGVSASNANGLFKLGDVVTVQVSFSKTVTVAGGTPSLTLETGAVDRTVNYTSGSGTGTLVFSYTVGAGDVNADLDYVATGSLSANGATIRDGHLNDATLTLATPGAGGSLAANKNLDVDGAVAVVTGVSASNADGLFKLGDVVTVLVSFSKVVTVAGGTPTLTLETGAVDRTVSYTSGSGTSTLNFSYTVGAGDVNADLDYVAAGSLLANGATIRDSHLNDATLTLAAPGAAGSLAANKNLDVDGVVAVVTGVSASNADGLFKLGDVLTVQVSFSKTVTVAGGTPSVTLETGTVDRTVNYTSGSGTSTLVFSYTVGAGDVNADLDYVATGSLSANGATIRDSHLNDATLTLAAPGAAGSLAANKNLDVDGVVAVVTGVSASNANGLFKLGDVVTVQVSFSKTVAVAGGTPTLTLETGAVDRTANYTSGSGTSTLSFSYTVGAGDLNADLDYVATGSLSANGATIRDSHLNDATLTLATPGAAGSLAANKNLDVDGAVAVVTGVSASNANGLFKLGDVVTVQVSFSKTVAVAGGTPTLTLETGAVDRTVNYTSGSGTSTLVFSYTVGAGDVNADLDYVATGSLSANGATIRDSHLNDATLTLATPGSAGSLAANKNLDVDGAVAVVTGVSASNANGLFKLGDVLTVQVSFSKVVTVAGGTPTLTLETGAVDRTVNYTGGSGTSTLVFSYTVGAGDVNADLDYVAAGSLSANGATIRDSHLNDATLTLAAPGAAGSLAANKNLDVDGVVAVVTSVSASNANGLFKLGDMLTVQVSFSKVVTVAGGTPSLTLETGAVDRTVNYTSGSGTSTLVFSYTVGAGDVNADLDYVATGSLSANGATIRDSHLNDATLTLATPGAAGSLAANKNLDVDGVVAVVTGVSASNANGLFKLGDVVTVQVSFSKVVTVAGGTPTLTLETGAVDRTVNYTGGSGTSTLVFSYTVGAGDVNADLDYVAAGSLSANGATIRDSHLNDATLTLAAPGAAGSLAANKNLDVDGVVAVVTGVSASNADGLFKLGDAVTVQVSFSKVVTVAGGTPTLTLETGAVDRTVNYSSGSGTSTLVFSYTVGAGDLNADLDYVAAGSLSANGATIRDNHLNDATLTLAAPGAAGSLAANKNLDVDGAVAVVTGVSASNANGLFKLGDVVTVQVSFSKMVTVAGGTPTLTLETGAVDRTVNYTSGSGTSTLVFSYTVGAGDLNADLDYVATGSLSANGATIRDSHLNDATLTLAAPGAAGSLAANKNLDVDGVVAVVTGVSASNANGLFKLGDVVTVQVSFSKVVTVAGGTPTLTLETGAVDRTVNYASGSGTSTLVFSYTVGAGDLNADLDYVAAGSLSANGATIRDNHLNDATLTLAAPGAAGSLAANKNLDVDGVVAVVTGVSASNANGLFKLGDVVTVQVSFSKVVTVAGGTPTLTLETGAVDRTVSYTSGSGTSTLVFSYTVGAGDVNADLDYVATGSLSANGATIRDSHLNDATLTLAAPGAAGSLAANKNLDVDGAVAVVTGVSASSANGLYKLGDVVTVQVSLSKAVTVAGGTPSLTLETGAVDRTVSYTGGSGTSTLVFSYTVGAGDVNADLDYVATGSLSANGATIRDSHLNDATLTLAAPGAAGSLAANKNLDVDGVMAAVTGVSASNANGLFKLGDVLTVQVSFSKAVTVAGGTPSLTLETGAVDRTVNYSSGSGTSTLVFSYTVGAGDLNADLDYVAAGSLSANGATIRDSHLNDATLTLATPGAAGSLAANKNLDVDAVAAVVTGVSASNANGLFKLGDLVTVQVSFSKAVTVAGGTPTLALETGAVDRMVNYTSGSGTSTLVFSYTVGAGDLNADLDYVATGSLSANGATIRDSHLNDATLTLAAPGAAGSLAASKNLDVDGVVAVVTGVSASNADGLFKLGDMLTVQVSFSKAVIVAGGTPTLTLETGAVDRTVNYTSGNGTSTLVFSYTVGAGDANADLDFAATGSLSANGATIRDGHLNDATLTLVTPGAAGSLAANKNLDVDGVVPLILGHTYTIFDQVDVQMSEGVFHTGGSALTPSDLSILFVRNGGNATSAAILSLTSTSDTPLAGGESVIRIRLSFTGVPDGLETITVIPATANSVFDLAGNPMAGAQTTGAIALIPSAITIVSRETQDSDGDGHIDQIKITTLPTQNLNDNFSGLTISVAGYTVVGYTTGAAGDNVFYVNLAEGASFDTGATPIVRVMSNDTNLQAADSHTIVMETTGVAATDAAPPVVGVTLAAVNGSRIYVEFSEPVTVATGDITCATSTVISPIGPREVFLNVSPPLTALVVTAGQLTINANAIHDAVGLPVAAATRPISQLMLDVVIPVWAHDGVHTDIPASKSGALKVFDGTGKLLDRDITLEARFATATWPVPLDIIFDAAVPPSLKPRGFWLPAGIDGLAPADTASRSVVQVDPAGDTDQLRDFAIPASDSKVADGNTIEFLFAADFGFGARYCLRALDPNDPRTVRPYAFKISDVLRQKNGVTIVENVINPTAGDRTRLSYTLSKSGRVTIQVFSLGGDIVNVLYSGYQAAGDYSASWDGRNRAGWAVARNVYFIRIVAPEIDEIRKVLVVK